jgi:phosphoribosylglycinamide formyltransferase-1
MTTVLNTHGVDLVLLIGFMRILSPQFCRVWQNKLLNVHPSLLPKYAGGMDTNVHEEVLKNGDAETGCTIHFVTEEVDGGPILIQKKCPIFSNDNVDTLKVKVQALEGLAFVEAINIVKGRGVLE